MPEPGGGNDPLSRLVGDLAKMMETMGGAGTSAGAAPWAEAAKALAFSVATGNAAEANPDPLARIRWEELSRVAELHVADATGFSAGTATAPVTFVPVGRGAWVLAAVDAYRPLVQDMVDAQARATAGVADGLDDPSTGGEPGSDGIPADMLATIASAFGPVMLGMQFGSAMGHLAQRALGPYALPLPRPASREYGIIVDNVAQFAEDWSLKVEEAGLWVCVHELTAHRVLSRPHVAERIGALLHSLRDENAALQHDLAERLGGEAGDPEAFQRLLADPESLLADLLGPGPRATSDQLTALLAAVGGYVDHTTTEIAGHLTGSPGPLQEAWYRYSTQDPAGEQAAGAFFGLDLTREQVERGASFVRGVLERGGTAGLDRLWAEARNLPTPAEVDAPGLWLERIDLPVDDDGTESPAGGAG
jgi:putative hydrolase